MSSAKKQNKYSKKTTGTEVVHRYDRLDALRGLAMVWMTIFHLCFDLNYFGFIHQNFYEDIFWTAQRSCIVSLFLICAGVSQAISVNQGVSWSRFWKRWRQVAGATLLVTVGSYIVYPESFIYFGVLHAVAVMLILMRLTARTGNWLWVMGAGVIALKMIIPSAFALWPALEVLNHPLLNWIGIVSYKPHTEDYAPLIPWLGVMWLGLAAGFAILKNKSEVLTMALTDRLKPLAFIGRYSLSYYLLHQPILFAIIMLVKKLF